MAQRSQWHNTFDFKSFTSSQNKIKFSGFFYEFLNFVWEFNMGVFQIPNTEYLGELKVEKCV